MHKQITDEALEMAMKIVKPLRCDDCKLVWLAPSDPRHESFPWEENVIGPAENLQEHRRVETWHTFGYYGFFKPTLAECLAHITIDDVASGVCGVECRVVQHDNWRQTLVEHEGKQFHRGVTIFCKPVEESSTVFGMVDQRERKV